MGTRTGARFLPREVDRAGAQLATTQARDHGLDLDRASARIIVESLGAGAPGVLPALFRLEALLPRLASELDRNQFVEAPSPAVRCPLDADADAVKSSLRAARDEALVRVTLRELLATVDVDQTAREWSEAASDCVDHALAAAGAMVAARNGPPLDYTARPVGLSVLGMGKLGGRELNLGSDIDICLFYATDEGSAGDRPLAVHFARVGSVLVDLLADVTAQGFAFRVDLRLRPEGRQGPIACSHATAERYYHTWGRPWERAALLRARPIAGDRAVGRALLDALKPFVFRREVDPAITETLRDMLSRSRKEQLRDDARDLKLGSGGIREAEFFVQSWQLLWGGLHPSLQVPSTLRALSRLRALGLVSDRDARDLDDAWGLLRRVEHRIQTVAPYATHTLPEDPARLAVLARSLGYPDAEELIGALDLARARVRELSDGMVASLVRPVILIDPRSPGARLARVAASGLDDPATPELVVEALGVRDVDAALSDLRRLARRPDLPLGAETAAQVPDFGPRLLSEVRDAPDPDLALSHVATLFERVFPPERYARWLLDRPSVLRGLVGLFGASEQLSRALLARPQLIETFVTNSAAPDPEEIRAWIEAAAAMGSASSEGDPEVIVGSLRRAMREAMLSVGVADLAGELSPAQVGERLTALAEAVVVESASTSRAPSARPATDPSAPTPSLGSRWWRRAASPRASSATAATSTCSSSTTTPTRRLPRAVSAARSRLGSTPSAWRSAPSRCSPPRTTRAPATPSTPASGPPGPRGCWSPRASPSSPTTARRPPGSARPCCARAPSRATRRCGPRCTTTSPPSPTPAAPPTWASCAGCAPGWSSSSAAKTAERSR